MLGIGAFTILDGKKVTGEDAGVNFFLDEQSIGSARGEEACKYISELNPDVNGHHLTQVPPSGAFIDSRISKTVCRLPSSPTSPLSLQQN